MGSEWLSHPGLSLHLLPRAGRPRGHSGHLQSLRCSGWAARGRSVGRQGGQPSILRREASVSFQKWSVPALAVTQDVTALSDSGPLTVNFGVLRALGKELDTCRQAVAAPAESTEGRRV